MTESMLIEALEGAKELFVELKRLTNELAAVKEENRLCRTSLVTNPKWWIKWY